MWEDTQKKPASFLMRATIFGSHAISLVVVGSLAILGANAAWSSLGKKENFKVAAIGSEPAQSLQQPKDSAPAQSSELPAALASLGAAGMTVEKRFATEIDGVEGVVVLINGEQNMVYSIEGGRYVIVGMLLGENQHNLTQAHAEKHLRSSPFGSAAPADNAAARRLPARDGGIEAASALAAAQGLPFVIEEGRGEKILYVTMDPNCPHCSNYYRETRSLLDEVTIRWIPLGFLGPESMRQAALLVEHSEPLSALEQMQSGVLAGKPSEQASEIIYRNTMAMRDAGLTMTPVTIYEAPGGTPKVVRGALSAEQIRQLR